METLSHGRDRFSIEQNRTSGSGSNNVYSAEAITCLKGGGTVFGSFGAGFLLKIEHYGERSMIRRKYHFFHFPHLYKSPVKSTNKVYNLTCEKATKLNAFAGAGWPNG